MTAPDPPDPDPDPPPSLLTSEEEPLSGQDSGFGGVLKALATPPVIREVVAVHGMIGRLVGGKYRLLRLIGQGGMGNVYEATGPSGEVVAVKIMSPSVDQSPESRLRFARELHAAMAIQSPHVVRVIDAENDPIDGPPFLAMERLRGLDLRASLLARGPLEPRAASRLFFQACQGLSVAHGKNIVHRDIKPANLFLHEQEGGDLTLKICDLGIAKRLDLFPSAIGSTTLTQRGDVLGTLVYMSPEQLKSARTVDHRSDLWSLCASLYEALSGKKIWGDASSMGEIVVAVGAWSMLPLRRHAPQVPEALAAVVERGLHRDLAGRWQDAASLAAALLPFCGEPRPG